LEEFGALIRALSNPRNKGSDRLVVISCTVPASVTITIILTLFLGGASNAMGEEGDVGLVLQEQLQLVLWRPTSTPPPIILPL